MAMTEESQAMAAHEAECERLRGALEMIRNMSHEDSYAFMPEIHAAAIAALSIPTDDAAEGARDG